MKKEKPIFSEQEQNDLKNAFELYYRHIAASLPEKEVADITFSKKAEQKMKKLLKKRFSPPTHHRNINVLQWIAAISLICVLSSGIFFTSKKIHSILKSQSEGYDEYLPSLSGSGNSQAFHYLPDGLKYKKGINETSYGTAFYSGSGGKWLNVTNYTSDFPNDYYPKGESFLILNQFPASYAANENDGLIIVHLENSVYVIEGSYDKAELLKVAKSICEALQ